MAAEPVLRRVGMGGSDVRAPVGGSANDDRTIDETAAHVADLTGVIDDLVVGDGRKTPEHELNDRPQAKHGSAHTHADEGCFADRGVHDPLVAKSLPETACHFVGPVVLGDLLADEDYVRIAFDFLGKRLVKCFAVFDEGHDSRMRD